MPDWVNVKKEPTYTVRLFIAGDFNAAKSSMRRECMREGLCVTITPTTFVYTGGSEEGVEIGFVNYPRFPTTPHELLERAEYVARVLLNELCQESALLVANDVTIWLSRREEDK